MKPARFAYEAPRSLDEVLAFLASRDDAKLIAGGQSLAPMMNMRLAQPGCLVDLNSVAGLDFVRDEGDRLAHGMALDELDPGNLSFDLAADDHRVVGLNIAKAAEGDRHVAAPDGLGDDRLAPYCSGRRLFGPRRHRLGDG